MRDVLDPDAGNMALNLWLRRTELERELGYRNINPEATVAVSSVRSLAADAVEAYVRDLTWMRSVTTLKCRNIPELVDLAAKK